MAVRVPRREITTEQANLITKLLTFTPKEDFGAFQGNHFTQQQTKQPIQFFIVENGNDPQRSEVLLPFFFAWQLTGRPSNQHRQTPIVSFNFTGTLFEHQVEVAKQAYTDLTTKATANINVYPGWGKTCLAVYLAAQLHLHVIIEVPREFLCAQWKKSITDFSNATCWVVGETPPPKTIPNFTICMDTRVGNLPLEYRQKMGVLIIDEAHMSCTPSKVSAILGVEPRFIILETATPERRDGLHNMLYALAGTHSITVKNPKPFKVIKVCTGIEPEIKTTPQGRLDYNALLKTLSMDTSRNQMIVSIIEVNPEYKVMILTRLIEHVGVLMTLLQERGIPCDFFCGTKKNYNDARVLVATYSKASTGFDQSSMCATFDGIRIGMLILATSVKDLALLEQSAGRAMRHTCPVVIDFCDENNTMKTHFRGRLSLYRSLNATIEEMHMMPPGSGKKLKTIHLADGTTTQALC